MPTTQLGTRIDTQLHQKLKLLCVVEGQRMSDVVRELIEGWVHEREADPAVATRLEQLMARQRAIASNKK